MYPISVMHVKLPRLDTPMLRNWSVEGSLMHTSDSFKYTTYIQWDHGYSSYYSDQATE